MRILKKYGLNKMIYVIFPPIPAEHRFLLAGHCVMLRDGRDDGAQRPVDLLGGCKYSCYIGIEHYHQRTVLHAAGKAIRFDLLGYSFLFSVLSDTNRLGWLP